jgi:hypothetical protein
MLSIYLGSIPAGIPPGIPPNIAANPSPRDYPPFEVADKRKLSMLLLSII